MAADPATLAAVADVLQHDYLPGIRETIPYGCPLEQILETKTEEVSGDYAVMALRIGGNPGIGPRGDNTDLPNPGRQRFKQLNVPMRFTYGRCQFTGPAIRASRSNQTAFAKIMEDEMSSLGRDFRKVRNALNYGDGSACLAIAASVTTYTIVVDRWHPLFTANRVLDSYTDKTCTTQHMNSVTITSVDKSTLTLTSTAAHGASQGDFLFLEDGCLVAQMGLMGIFDDGTIVPTIQGVLRSSYPVTKAKIMTASDGRTISEDLLTDGVSLLEEIEDEPDFILGTIFQRQDLIKELKKQRQFVSTDGKLMKLKGGIRAIEMCDLPFMWDRDATAGYTFIGNTKHLAFYQSAPVSWMDMDGAVLSRVKDRDAYEATLYGYRELAADNFAALMRLDKINENRPSGY